MTKEEKELHRVAFHEAGHALAVWRLGSMLLSITIEPATWPAVRIPCAGNIRHTWARGPHQDGFAQRHAMILFAGPMAQEQHDPNSDIDWGGYWDFEEAENIANIACRSRDSVEPFLQLAEREARALVREYWHCVEALARALLTKPTLSGDEAVLIMESAESVRQTNSFEFWRAAVKKSQPEPFSVSC